ncbi:MAG: hypothetical protein ACLSHU_03630 [Oscillospiraceae bacterium]
MGCADDFPHDKSPTKLPMMLLYLRDKEHTLGIMAEHGRILKPKFQMVLDTLERELAPRELGHWQRPKGGYFESPTMHLPGQPSARWSCAGEAGRGDDCLASRLRIPTAAEDPH